MNLVVEQVSKFGFKSGGQWYNPDKTINPSFAGISRGCTVDVDVQGGKYVTRLALVGAGSVATPSSPASSAAPRTDSYNNSQRDPVVRIDIARSTAVKAVLASPAIAKLMEGKDESVTMSDVKVLIKQMTGYILSGEFTSDPPTDAVPF